MTFPTLNLLALLPQIILVVAALVILIADLLVAEKRILGWVSLVAVLGALAAALLLRPASPAFQTMALADGLGRFASAAVLIAAALAILLSVERVADFTQHAGAYYALILLATAGMHAMTIASDFMTIFIGLEILSLALYILVGFNRRDVRSGEAALKYFLLGAFASGFFLYGIALIYGGTGTTNLAGSAKAILPMSSSLPFAPLLPIGVGLLLVGFGFKVALVPFHMWTPDVYQGAPTPVTAFMSVGTKAAAFAALIRVLAALTSHDRPWLLALAVLAVLTMTLGNLAALRQTSLKRMLAYSSIAHAGYILTGLAAGNQKGVAGRALLPAGLHLHEPGRLRRAAGRAAARGERRVRRADGRAGEPPTGPGRADGDLHVLAGRHPAAGRLLRQAVRLQRRGGGRAGLAGDRRRDQQRHRRVLLPARDRLDVHDRARRRGGRDAADRMARLGDGRDRGHRNRGPGPLAVPVDAEHHPGGGCDHAVNRDYTYGSRPGHDGGFPIVPF